MVIGLFFLSKSNTQEPRISAEKRESPRPRTGTVPCTKFWGFWYYAHSKGVWNGGGGWTRTNDLRIMSSIPDSESKQNQIVSSEEWGKVGQNPQPRRNLNSIPKDDGKEQV